ncbi:hypothetical protein OIHEL45_18006, partial [Sulfitobacter indolifex HEL-45]
CDGMGKSVFRTQDERERAMKDRITIRRMPGSVQPWWTVFMD